jgi:hypothetical protein
MTTKCRYISGTVHPSTVTEATFCLPIPDATFLSVAWGRAIGWSEDRCGPRQAATALRYPASHLAKAVGISLDSATHGGS